MKPLSSKSRLSHKSVRDDSIDFPDACRVGLGGTDIRGIMSSVKGFSESENVSPVWSCRRAGLTRKHLARYGARTNRIFTGRHLGSLMHRYNECSKRPSIPLSVHSKQAHGKNTRPHIAQEHRNSIDVAVSPATKIHCVALLQTLSLCTRP